MLSKYFQNYYTQKNDSDRWKQKRGNNEAPLAQVCAVCFDNNRKLYIMTRFQLAEMYETLTGHSFENNMYLPQTLCSECTQRLISCSQFRDKCLRARELMLDILKDNETLTMQNIQLIDRDKNLLKSNIKQQTLIPNQCDLYIIDERDNKDVKSVTEELKQEVDDTMDTENISNQSNCVDIDNDAGEDGSCYGGDAASNIDCDVSDHSSDNCLSHIFNIKYGAPNNSKKFDNHYTNVIGSLSDSTNSENNNDDYNEVFNKKSSKDKQINKIVKSKNLKSFKYRNRNSDKKACRSKVDENNEHTDINVPVASENINASGNGIESFDLDSITDRKIRINLIDNSKSNRVKMFNKPKQTNKIPPRERKSVNTKTKKLNYKMNNTTKLRITSVKWVKINDEKTLYSTTVFNNTAKSESKATESKLFVCDHCQKVFYQRKLIVKHLRRSHTDRKAYTCSYCGYRCLFNSTLVRHIRKHTGEKPFACDLCDYTCKISSQLKRHKNTRHSTAKPYLCHICSYSSNDQNTLKRHMNTHRVDKPYSCHLCKFKCKGKASLTQHIKIHSSVKRFACELCEYRCKRLDMLRKHTATHTGAKPFSCLICPYRCLHKVMLTKHMKKHTNEKPFKCELCSYESKEKVFLTKHKNKCHIKNA